MSNADTKIVIVTRPEDRFCGTADVLKAAGFNSISFPILTPNPVEPIWPDGKPDIYVFTSARCFDYIDKDSVDIEAPYLCVGEKTKAAAEDFGFHAHRGCFEDIDTLSKALNGHENDVIWHIGGTHTEGLAFQGIHHHVCVYDMAAREALSEEEYQILSGESPHAVLFYSARTARHFERCVRAAGLAERLNEIKAVCISKNVANCLDFNLWSDIISPELKTESAVIEALTRTA